MTSTSVDKYAICFVTDEGYMVPSLVAASQARVAAPGLDVDVFVFALGVDADKAAQYRIVAARNNVVVIIVDRDLFGGESENSFIDDFFSNSAFTFGALGRLFLDQILPPQYTQILYIDGDVQISGSLDELVRAPVPEGYFLATPDPKIYWIFDDTPAAKREREYMAGLGFKEGELTNYFNSGVLRINRTGWRDIGLKAWEFLKANPERCICHDQSALNAVGRDRRLPMSQKWNYPSYWDFFGLRRNYEFKIVHFMSRPKPWNGVFFPWGKAEHKVYLDFVAANPEIASELKLFSMSRTIRYRLQQRLKWLDSLRHQALGKRVGKKALEYETRVVI